MNNRGAYILFFAVVAMLQIFLLNNLTVSVRFAPMVYVVCIIMLPLEISQMRILLVGLLLGVLMDVTMGVNGLNVVATLPVAFFRRPILHFVAGFSDLAKADGVPSPERLGGYRFHRYVVSMVVLHSMLFFGFEWLSFDNFGFFLTRLLCSTASSLALDYLLIFLFMPKLSPKS